MDAEGDPETARDRDSVAEKQKDRPGWRRVGWGAWTQAGEPVGQQDPESELGDGGVTSEIERCRDTETRRLKDKRLGSARIPPGTADRAGRPPPPPARLCQAQDKGPLSWLRRGSWGMG